jgi:hypothetical protein
MENKNEGTSETDPNKLSETFKELYSLFGPHILNTDLDEKPTEGVNKGVNEGVNEGVNKGLEKTWQDMAKGLFDKYITACFLPDGCSLYHYKYDVIAAFTEAAEAGYERGRDSINAETKDFIRQSIEMAKKNKELREKLANKDKELEDMKQQLTHHDDVVGTLAEMMLENAKLKLQLLDQATIIENLRTDRNNYRNLYEDLKQDCQDKPDIRNINS